MIDPVRDDPNQAAAEREAEDASRSAILEEIEELPPSERIEIARVVLERHEELRGRFQLDLPPPWILQEYADIIPDAGNRWMVLTEEQSRHRRHIETVVIEGDSKRAARGLDYGFAAVALVVGAAVIAMILGYPKLAGGLILIDIIGLAATFIYGSISRRHERESRRNAPPPGPTPSD